MRFCLLFMRIIFSAKFGVFIIFSFGFSLLLFAFKRYFLIKLACFLNNIYFFALKVGLVYGG